MLTLQSSFILVIFLIFKNFQTFCPPGTLNIENILEFFILKNSFHVYSVTRKVCEGSSNIFKVYVIQKLKNVHLYIFWNINKKCKKGGF